MLGSTQINETCKNWIVELLRIKNRNKPLEEGSGLLVENIVDICTMPTFERETKRIFEGADSTTSATFHLSGLEADTEDKRIRKNKLKLSR